MEWSSFAVVKRFGDQVLLWHTRTKTKLVLDRDSWDRFRGSPTLPTLFNLLVEKGYIVDDAEKERADYHQAFISEEARRSTALDLTFVTSLACNLHCTYCFQNEVKELPRYGHSTLPEDQQDQVLTFVGGYVDRYKLQRIDFKIFGGEPLIHYDMFLRFSDRVGAIAKERGLPVRNRLVTNGTLLNHQRLLELASRSYEFYVTLDIQEMFGSPLRVYKNGRGSLEVTRHWAREASRNSPVNVNIVVNEKFGKLTPRHVAMIFEGFTRENLWITIGPEIASDHSYHEGSRTLLDKLGSCVEILELLREQGHRVVMYDEAICPTYFRHSITVDPSGRLTKCSARIGYDDFVVSEGLGRHLDDFDQANTRWLSRLVTSLSEQCRKCSVLPVCGGGCFADNKNTTGSLFKKTCPSDELIDQKASYLLAELGMSVKPGDHDPAFPIVGTENHVLGSRRLRLRTLPV